MNGAGVGVVLPARYQSSRFPGKPLAVIAGRPLIQWVHRRASQIRGVARVLVATDDDRIAAAVRSFGGEAVMTGEHHTTGTDRVAEVARKLDEEYVVNLQGDEPLFPPELVEEMIDVLRGHGPTRASDRHGRPIDIVTACHPISNSEEIEDPNIVKVVMDGANHALYFSRAPIPFVGTAGDKPSRKHYRHVGIYAFRKTSLLQFANTRPTPLEKSENLEQLRALESGMNIRVIRTEYATIGVDVPADIKNVEKALTSIYAL